MKQLCVISTIILITCSGCSYWSSLDHQYSSETRNFEVTFPKGWKKDTRIHDVFLGTKDGTSLQFIQISRVDIDDDLKFTKRKFKKDMLSQEVADVAIDNLRSAPERIGFEVLENTPDSICGLPGFRILAQWKSIEGLRKRDILYGLTYDEKYYEVLYEAPVRYYFDR